MIESIEAVLITAGVLVYLVMHSIRFDWHRSRVGILMNSTLMAVVVVVIGNAIPGLAGAIVTGLGVATFLVCLYLRAVLLTSYTSYTSRKDKDQ